MNGNGYLPMFNERKDADKRLLGLVTQGKGVGKKIESLDRWKQEN